MLLVVPSGQRYAGPVKAGVAFPFLIIEIGPVLLWECIKNALVNVAIERLIPALVTL